MIAIVDYGMGNLRSVQKALEQLGYSAAVTDDPAEVKRAAGLVLPGVGAFADAMENLKARGLAEAIKEAAAGDKPFLGICLGLQLLFTESEENGVHRGLDILPGRVLRFQGRMKVPHMGWNQIAYRRQSPIMAGIPAGSFFYFVHSYYVVPDDPGVVTCVTDYGSDFVSVVSRGKLFGIQFHPEKSSRLGLQILKNFGELVSGDSVSGH